MTGLHWIVKKSPQVLAGGEVKRAILEYSVVF
jgi:hypothetical protein